MTFEHGTFVSINILLQANENDVHAHTSTVWYLG